MDLAYRQFYLLVEELGKKTDAPSADTASTKLT
jgi:hypothetical protein